MIKIIFCSLLTCLPLHPLLGQVLLGQDPITFKGELSFGLFMTTPDFFVETYDGTKIIPNEHSEFVIEDFRGLRFKIKFPSNPNLSEIHVFYRGAWYYPYNELCQKIIYPKRKYMRNFRDFRSMQVYENDRKRSLVISPEKFKCYKCPLDTLQTYIKGPSFRQLKNQQKKIYTYSINNKKEIYSIEPHAPMGENDIRYEMQPKHQFKHTKELLRRYTLLNKVFDRMKEESNYYQQDYFVLTHRGLYVNKEKIKFFIKKFYYDLINKLNFRYVFFAY